MLTVKETRQLLDELGCAQPVRFEPMNWYSKFECWLFCFEKGMVTGAQPPCKVMGISIEVSR